MEVLKFNLKEFLSRSFNDIDSLDLVKFIDEALPLTDGIWLGGGAIRRTLMGYKEVESDFDVFFRDKELKTKYVEDLERRGAVVIAKNDSNVCYEYHGFKIQCIHISFYKSPVEVIDSFDFTICQFITDGKELLCNPLALYDLGRKRLAVHKVTYPVASLRRLLKYTSQGFYACSGCLYSLLESVARTPSMLNENFHYID